MRTTISPGQWQPWTAVSPLLGLINIAQPSSQWTGDPVSQREISNKSSNVASRSELGRLPLIINIYKNFPYFILYLLRKNEDKLQFYSIFKHDYKISSYLDSVKIRTNNNKLMIETGRYNQTPHNDRFCPVCNYGIIEDEFHFLLHCPKYSIPREKFYNQIQHNLLILFTYLAQN